MASLLGSIGLVASGTELAVQAASADQRGLVDRIIPDERWQRVAKGAIATVALLSLAGIAFDTSASVRKPKRA